MGLTTAYAQKYYDAVKNVGYEGSKRTLGNTLFEAVLSNKSGVILSKHDYADMWSLMKTADKRVHLAIPKMFTAIQELATEDLSNKDYPFILMAGERRSYNANQIYRDTAWRKTDPKGMMRMNPQDAEELGITNGTEMACQSAVGSIQVVVEIDKSVRPKMVTLPNGYGLQFKNNTPVGPQVNMLTPSHNCEPFTKTPFHKYVPVKILKLEN